MSAISVQKSEPSTQAVGLVLSILLFLPPALAVVTYRYLQLPYAFTAWVQYGWALGMILATVAGWLRGFPRWVYPYGLAVLGLVTVLLVARDSDMTWQENLFFKLVVLGPLALLFLLVWLFFHKRHPLHTLIGNIRRDWTLLSFAVYGLLPLVVFSIFTDIRSLYGAPFLAVATLVMIAGACTYLLLADPFQRLFVLGSALTVTWLVSGLGSATFWHGRRALGAAELSNGYVLSLQYVIAWAVMLALLLLPMLVVTVRRARARG